MSETPLRDNSDWDEVVDFAVVGSGAAGLTGALVAADRGARTLVIEKSGASVFLGTPLLAYLNDMGVDPLIIAGTTTSGCVRATAVDASNLNLHAAVVEECTFDRVEISHKVSLMDLNAKYAKVISLGEGLEYLKTSAQPSVARAAGQHA